MSETLIPGRVVVLKDREELVAEIAERMNYAGLSASVFATAQSGVCALTVAKQDEARSRAFLQKYFSAASESQKDEDLNNFRASFLCRCPSFMSAEDKVKNKTSSAFAFLGISLFTMVHLANDLIRDNENMIGFDAFTCLVFTSFTVHILSKLRELKKAQKEEEDFTEKVLTWFFGSYSAEQLDHMILSSHENCSDAELDIHRLDLIRDYIGREFSIEEPFLSHLTDCIFEKLYQTGSEQ